MRVLFDYQIFQMQRYGGISRGCAEIISHFKSTESIIAVKESDNVYLKEYNLLNDFKSISKDFDSFLPKIHFRGKRRIYNFLTDCKLIESAEIRNRTYCIKLLQEGKFDVFHPTYFSPYFKNYLNGKPFVLTVHDLTAEKFPQYFGKYDYQINGRKQLVPIASHIVVPSESTRRDVLERWNLPEEKVSRVYRGGVSPITGSFENIIDSPYILFVGLRDGYKNFNRFIIDSIPFLRNNPEVKIICTGKEFSGKELNLLHKYNISERVQAKFVSSDDLKALYCHAICFVFPSLSEGFGLPILEAFSCGCPVLLINKSCFPEIGGDAAFFYESDKKDSNLSDKLEYLYGLNETDRLKVKEKGYHRLNDFSWDKSAAQYEDIYKSLI